MTTAVTITLFNCFFMFTSSFDIPRFSSEPEREKCTNFLLSSVNNHWHVGCPNTLSVLSENQYLNVHIQTTGHIVTEEFSLNVYCPEMTTSNQPIKITLRKDLTAATYCDHQKMIIKLETYFEGYKITLISSTLESEKVFTEFIRLTVTATVVDYTNQRFTFTSNVLQIYSLDPLLNWKESNINTHFLASSVVETFFKKTPYDLSSEDYPTIQFINPLFIQAISKVKETFFNHLLSIGGLTDLGSSDCKAEVTKQILLVNHLANVNYKTANQIYYYLDSKTGQLTFSKNGLAITANTYANDPGDKRSSVCVNVGLGNLVIFKRVIVQTNKYDTTNYASAGRFTKCTKVNTVDQVSFRTFYSGFSRFAIKCPIICDYPAAIEFKHGSKRLISTPNGEDPTIYHNSLVFHENIQLTHAGNYSCQIGALAHQYIVKVVSLPRFRHPTDILQDGNLPPVIYAMEGERLSFSCKVYFFGVSLTLQPRLYPLTNGKWNGPFDLQKYNQFLNVSNIIKTEIDRKESDGFASLNIDIKNVPSKDVSTQRNFTHRFECYATVNPSDVKPLNMATYSTVTGTSVIYIPVPTSKDIVQDRKNDCLVQGCSLQSGATFSYTMSKQFADDLKFAGVQITAYFMLDDINLDQIPVMKKTKVVFSNTDLSIKWIVPAVKENDQELTKELLKRKTLKAVYNFLHNGSVSTQLEFDKSKYGNARVGDSSDCRNNKFRQCFFSTDFLSQNSENNTSTEFLVTKLMFTEVPPSTANFGMLIGIILAALIVVLLLIVIAVLSSRDHGQTYMLGDKEVKQGIDVRMELKNEQFKEYQRPQESYLLGSKQSLIESISIVSDDDNELNFGSNINIRVFDEDGSFIDSYAANSK